MSSYGEVIGAGHGSNYMLQMRTSGEFVLNDLTAGCSAAVAASYLPLKKERQK